MDLIPTLLYNSSWKTKEKKWRLLYKHTFKLKWNFSCGSSLCPLFPSSTSQVARKPYKLQTTLLTMLFYDRFWTWSRGQLRETFVRSPKTEDQFILSWIWRWTWTRNSTYDGPLAVLSSTICDRNNIPDKSSKNHKKNLPIKQYAMF